MNNKFKHMKIEKVGKLNQVTYGNDKAVYADNINGYDIEICSGINKGLILTCGQFDSIVPIITDILDFPHKLESFMFFGKVYLYTFEESLDKTIVSVYHKDLREIGNITLNHHHKQSKLTIEGDMKPSEYTNMCEKKAYELALSVALKVIK